MTYLVYRKGGDEYLGDHFTLPAAKKAVQSRYALIGYLNWNNERQGVVIGFDKMITWAEIAQRRANGLLGARTMKIAY
jgi:hypothetical protein